MVKSNQDVNTIKEKHVIFLAHYFFPHIGGVENHVLNISKKLIEQRFSVTVVSSRFDNKLRLEEQHDQINIVRIDGGITDWRRPSITKLWKWMFKNKNLFQNASLIHCHDVFIWYLPLRLLFPNKKVYITFHGFEGVYPLSKKAILIRKLSEVLTSGNICIGDFIMKWYFTKADIISYGGNDYISTKEVRKSHKKKLLYLGRLDPDSGLDTVLKALDILKRKKVDFEIEFCGSGSMNKEAKRYGKVHGFVSNPSRFIKNNHFVLTSGYLAMLESMAMSRLVFSTYSNPLKRDYLLMSPFKDLAIISKSAEEFADNIEYYLNNTKAEKTRIKKAFKWAIAQSWGKVAQNYLYLWSR